jgi:hypothetical protein
MTARPERQAKPWVQIGCVSIGIHIKCDAVQQLVKKGIMPRARGRISLKAKLRCVGQTDTGRVRDHNEDTIAYDADIGLLVLADGMGGYNAGEVASGIAVKTIA